MGFDKLLKACFVISVLWMLFSVGRAFFLRFALRAWFADKPVIYLYPPEEMEVSVSLGIPADNFICTYPRYDDGWEVTARPDGTLVNKADGEEYSYLFWEAKMEVAWDMPDGFLVKGADSEEFFREKLRFLGLLPKEYNEFIVYWLPRLQKNEYNLIRFAGAEYENAVPLEISPPPDSILRVFMIFRKAKSDEVIPQQELTAFERRGFAAVEWGGAEIGASGADYVFEG